MALEIKLRAERKAGQFIADMKEQDLLSKGGRPTETGNKVLPVLPTLKELGVEKVESQRWQRIAAIPEERFEEFINGVKKKTQDALLQIAHVGNATGENEWYTPEEYIIAAKELMKNIDVDPASSDIANQTVIATKYYTAEDDGRIQKWEGNVWMNPPYAQPLVTEFCDLLVEKFKSGEVKQACVLVNNATETNFYQNMMENCQAICFIKGRVKFIDREGKSTGTPLQGQTILYFGGNHKEFGAIFSQFGVVLHAGK
jgi:ParB family chromosome partitioning protein